MVFREINGPENHQLSVFHRGYTKGVRINESKISTHVP
jgi:hypothetical protein